MYETDWAQPNPADLTDPSGPPLPDEERLVARDPLPDTEAVLSELGAFYPVVAYPDPQRLDDGEEALDRTIFAGLVNS